jgi:hypothetical protein
MTVPVSVSGFLLGSSAVLSRLWQIGIHSERMKTLEYKQADIEEAISNISSVNAQFGLRIAGPLLLGISRVFHKKVDMYESRIQSVSAHIEMVLHSGGVVIPHHRRVSSVSRKRSSGAPSVDLLPSLPESYVLDDFASYDSMNDLVPITAAAFTPSRSGTPSRRASSSARRREADVVFEAAMTPGDSVFPEFDSTKRRRLSTVSEVMDSLRADDGTRRMSGILGSMTDASLPGTPLMFDHDIFGGSVANSPWPMQPYLDEGDVNEEEAPVASRTRAPRQRAFLRKSMDKRGGIDRTQVDQNRIDTLNIVPSRIISELISRKQTLIFPLAAILSDRHSFFKWGPKRVAPPVQPPASPLELYEPGEDIQYDDEYIAPPAAPQVLLDRVPYGDPIRIDAVLTTTSRSSVVADFVQILHLASSGRVSVVNTGNKVDFDRFPSLVRV